jgi:hypothetical protein
MARRGFSKWACAIDRPWRLQLLWLEHANVYLLRIGPLRFFVVYQDEP